MNRKGVTLNTFCYGVGLVCSITAKAAVNFKRRWTLHKETDNAQEMAWRKKLRTTRWSDCDAKRAGKIE